eukprot:CAMPEP_0197397494 /NCGR_PEP_ID=MMETSP1165-20131217/11613_1 /TAXON_ID=284809 /ORGANISM="Chrysocystis fragilis, Strain CCMP3189" /LENGTH=291 /DNA_ID=CAMNT_0042923393 /DNA_START=22 /DNA_END=897 /DNA_ORIENTATION=-
MRRRRVVLMSAAVVASRAWQVPAGVSRPAAVRGTPPDVEPPSEEARYVLGRPGDLDADLRLLGTSRARIVQFVSLAAFLGLAGDLFGVTSTLLSVPALREPARRAGLDTYYPVAGFKRYAEPEFELLYPETWLEDQAVYVARTAARAGTTDAEALLRKRRPGPEPLVAFGPPGGTASENLSVFKSDLAPGFSLQGTLGPPAVAAQTLLDRAIAPPGSGKTAELIDAFATASDTYVFEYTLALTDRTLHNLAVIAQRQGKLLYTLTLLCRDADWPDREATFRAVASSFRVRQ